MIIFQNYPVTITRPKLIIAQLGWSWNSSGDNFGLRGNSKERGVEVTSLSISSRPENGLCGNHFCPQTVWHGSFSPKVFSIYDSCPKVFAGKTPAESLSFMPVSLCVSGAVRRDFDVCDVAACVFVARAASACIGRGPVPVIRELHVRCACVCVFAVQSVESCAYAVLFACGGLTSVEHWACPRLRRVGRGSVFVFAREFLIWFCSWVVYMADVRGGVCKLFGVSVCVFLFF